jgi:signal transduction histidine kinase
VANASHELRTPLGALQARLENIVDGVEVADALVFEDLLGQVGRLGDLVGQLLDLSKLESGAVSLERANLAAGELLGHVVEEWRAHATEREVRLVVDLEPATLAFRADRRRMQQVLSNLVANAVRHSPPGGDVVLRARGDNGSTRLEVLDEGPGSAPSESERVFERFYRSDLARSADDGGSGLGLSIARSIVEMHGGSIRVDPTTSPGCRIVVDLPR